MKKLLLSGLLIILGYSAFAQTKNYFFIEYGPGVKKLTFVYSGEHDDTQILESVKSFSNDNELKIVVTSDRKGSEDVAKSFNNLFNNEVKKIYGLNVTSDDKPKKLNFWIGGTLYINDYHVPYPVYFAQGNNGTSNNWWIGTHAGKRLTASRYSPTGSGSFTYFSIDSGLGDAFCLKGYSIYSYAMEMKKNCF